MSLLFHAASLLAISASLQADLSQASDDTPITIRERGLATTYSASKEITCANYEWRVKWESTSNPRKLEGDITVFVDGKGALLNDTGEELFAQFSQINSVSGTCNPARDGLPTRSSLLVSGTATETGTPAFAKIDVDPDFEPTLSIEID